MRTLALLLIALGFQLPGHAADQTVLGNSLVVKNPSTPDKRKITAKGKESGTDDSIVGNPVANGATLTITLGGGSPSNESYPVPTGTSGLTGKPFWSGDPTKGVKYKDPKGENGPVKGAQIKKSASGVFQLKIAIDGKLGAVGVVPPNPGTDGCVLFEITGGDSYSVQFANGQLTNHQTVLFKVVKPTSKGSCVPATTTTTETPSTTSTTTSSTTSTSTSSSTTSTSSSTSTSSTSSTTSTSNSTSTSTSTSSTTSTSSSTSTTTSSTTSTTLVSGCFQDWGDGTIRDTCTGLQWEKKVAGNNWADLNAAQNIYTWAGHCSVLTARLCQPSPAAETTCIAQTSAFTHGCEQCGAGEGTCILEPGAATTVWDWLSQVNAANYAGHNDWRLPSESGCNTCWTGSSTYRCTTCGAHELETILLASYPCATFPCINSIFGPTANYYYWSSSTYFSDPGIVWNVAFFNGAADWEAKTYLGAVRAVRTSP